MQVHNLSEANSILNTFIAEMRDENLQKDAMRFRINIERVGEILGYELSKHLSYRGEEISTPLGTSKINLN